MATSKVTINGSNYAAGTAVSATSNLSLTAKFLNWCDSLEFSRYGILAAIFAVQGGVIAPIALLIMFYFSPVVAEAGVLLSILSTMGVLVLNISVAPMRVIVIGFIVNLLIHTGLILASFI
ncbi:MAG: hypothetical protein ACK40G_07595 [Cytophagaceae bacterium]